MRRVVPIVVGIALIALLPGGTGWASSPGVEHLPDLQTLKPSDLRIEMSAGRKLLLFSNTVANVGDGRLELRPENPRRSIFNILSPSPSTTRAYQAVYSHTTSGSWYKTREQYVGTFKFHPEHSHWHFEKFALYELYTVAPDGSVGQSLNRVGEKTTFCLVDTEQVDSSLSHAASQTYTKCGQSDTTGISVGWADKYQYYLDGQSVDISSLNDGVYWLVSTVDYLDRLLETNNGNNSAQVKIQITGNAITALP